MADRRTCRLCETRKSKRFCPGIHGDICPQCCGEQREQTIHCPLSCPFLLEARKHEHQAPVAPAGYPHSDIRVAEDFIEENRELFTVVSLSLIKAAADTPGAVDSDLRDCLEAIIKTYLTLDSGLIYESKAANLVAAAVQDRMARQLAEFKKFAHEKTGVDSIRDSDVLKMLVFLQRLELTSSNGRRYGRAFLSSIRQAFEVAEESAAAPLSPLAAPASPSLII